MAIRESLNAQLSAIPVGEVFSLSDIDVPRQYQGALAKALSQFTTMGYLKRLAKGRYYKPRKTRFGEVRPSVEQIVKDYLVKDGEIIGYLTGAEAFSVLGLTTQVSGDIMVGTNRYRRPIKRGDYKITFLQQPNPIIAEDIALFRILDALRLFKSIPGTTTEESVTQLGNIINSVSKADQTRLIELVRHYPPFVRAMLGAMYDAQGLPTGDLEETLNPMTTYKLSIPNHILPTKQRWNIQ